MLNTVQIEHEIKAREDAAAILNQLAEGDGESVPAEFFDAAVRPLFRAAMHCEHEVEALSAAGVWFDEY